MIILTSEKDNFLYDRLILLLHQIKIVQGIPAVSSTLRRHSKVRNYLIDKQVALLSDLEETFFQSDGQLDHDSVLDFYHKSTLQK